MTTNTQPTSFSQRRKQRRQAFDQLTETQKYQRREFKEIYYVTGDKHQALMALARTMGGPARRKLDIIIAKQQSLRDELASFGDRYLKNWD